ncbi:glutaredoxin family protein [Candidatus Saccharibacteria bacterium]|nr:glutaredoxin family protein [Candidatus Saccharibacteria bacterium]
MKKVTIYTTPTCGFCHMAKNWMTQKGVKYTEKDVSVNIDDAKEMVEKSGQMGVPVIDIDGDITIGFDRPKLEHLLGA